MTKTRADDHPTQHRNSNTELEHISERVHTQEIHDTVSFDHEGLTYHQRINPCHRIPKNVNIRGMVTKKSVLNCQFYTLQDMSAESEALQALKCVCSGSACQCTVKCKRELRVSFPANRGCKTGKYFRFE